jgi:hypothetical protein
MPRVKRRGHVMSMLTDEQTFELLLGPTPVTEGAFASDSQRRSAWFQYRDEILASANQFSRPWGFWNFEIGHIPSRSAGERDVDLLRELNLLSEQERVILAGKSTLASMLLGRKN